LNPTSGQYNAILNPTSGQYNAILNPTSGQYNAILNPTSGQYNAILDPTRGEERDGDLDPTRDPTSQEYPIHEQLHAYYRNAAVHYPLAQRNIFKSLVRLNNAGYVSIPWELFHLVLSYFYEPLILT